MLPDSSEPSSAVRFPTAVETIWRSPLMPLAIAVTGGIVVDRIAEPPAMVALIVGGVCLVAAWFAGNRRLSFVYLLITFMALGASYHCWRCRLVYDNDIALIASREAIPVQLRGVIVDGPHRMPAPIRVPEREAMFSQPSEATATALMRVSYLIHAGTEQAVSGKVHLLVTGKQGQSHMALLPTLLPGDEIRVSGRLDIIDKPSNPGEFDFARHKSIQNVRTTLRIRSNASITRLDEGSRTAVMGWFASLRTQAHAVLQRELKDIRSLPTHEKRRRERKIALIAADCVAVGAQSTATSSVRIVINSVYFPNDIPVHMAPALLLSEDAPMTNEDWSKFVRTGVVHVLAISGQHLVVLAGAIWWVQFRVNARQRHGAILVAVVLLFYAFLTGGRPPAMRAAVVACAMCVAILLRRQPLAANLFAFAWLIVVSINPASIFEAGCQYSFLAVAVLSWCAPRFFPETQPDPIEELIDEARPAWLRRLRSLLWWIAREYLINLIVWVAIMPLIVYHTGMIPLVALLIGPPMTYLVSVALLLGFALFLASPLGCGFLFARPLSFCLEICEWIVDISDVPQQLIHVGSIPVWWIIGFYVGLFAFFTLPQLLAEWRRILTIGVAWIVCLLVVIGTPRINSRELRCTFLDVGHGGCSILEMPDARVMLFDVGAMRGPDVTSRIIAPYLHTRGIRRIDDIVLSHPDTDHHNGLLELSDRFAIGRVLWADSFGERKRSSVQIELEELPRRGIKTEIICAGDQLCAGEVTFDVLHPPRGWLKDDPNENSVTLLVRHGSRSLLLTGDLTKTGLERLLRQPPRNIDIVQAPHHGSRFVNVDGLTRWCSPHLAISCQSSPIYGRDGASYKSCGIDYWSTWKHGAITAISDGVTWRVTGHRGGSITLPKR